MTIRHISCVIVSFVGHIYITVVKFSPNACVGASVRACAHVYACVRARACVRCVRACVHAFGACVRACVHACVRVYYDDDEIILGIIALVAVKAE